MRAVTPKGKKKTLSSKGKHRKNRNTTITIKDRFKMVNNPQIKNDICIQELSIRTEPMNKKSPIIKKKYIPLDIPENIYKVLQAFDKIDDGIKGNKISNRTNMFSYFGQCLKGEAKRQFNSDVFIIPFLTIILFSFNFKLMYLNQF